CQISRIENAAFYSVSNVVELDLSHNLIDRIPTQALKECRIMSKLYLNNNPITRLENVSFVDLSSLRGLDLSNCQIEYVAANAFEGLKSLRHLHLNGNKLRDLSGFIIETLPSLNELNLYGNEWHCDCRLRDLKAMMAKQNIPLSSPPSCRQPQRLRDVSWSKLELEDFACPPIIESIGESMVVYEGENASLTCRVISSPSSDIDWQWKGRLIGNLSLMSFGKQMYLIKETVRISDKSSTLYIINALEKDNGRYTCLASNRAGNASYDIILSVIPRKKEVVAEFSGEEVAGIVLGLLFVFLFLFLVVCFFVLRNKESIALTAVLTSEDREKNLSTATQNATIAYSTVEREQNNCINSVSMNKLSNDSSLPPSRRNSTNNVSSATNTTVKVAETNRLDGNNQVNCDEDDVKTDAVPVDKCLEGYSRNIFCDQFINSRVKRCNEAENVSTVNASLPVARRKLSTENVEKVVSASTIREPKQVTFVSTDAVPTSHFSTLSSSYTNKFDDGSSESWKFRRRPSQQNPDEFQLIEQSKSNDYPQARYSSNATISSSAIAKESLLAHSVGPATMSTMSPRASQLKNGYNNYATLRMPQKSLKGMRYNIKPASGNATSWCRGVGGSVAALALEANFKSSPDEGLGEEKDYETDILD
ncbi:leucine-rich repeat and immunoglobulin-like domain containing-NOGO receptor-interacting protein 4, partial [Dinothrombium tinctorium]